LKLPQILPHTVEVFTDSEKVYTNCPDEYVPPMNSTGDSPNNLVDGQFLNFSGQKLSSSEIQSLKAPPAATKKSDLNQDGILWRFLEKKITTYMKKNNQE